MKKITTILSILTILLASPVAAQTSGIIYSSSAPSINSDVQEIAMLVIHSIVGLALAVILFCLGWGVYRWSKAHGNYDKTMEAKKAVVASIIVLIILMIAYAIASLVIERVFSIVTTL